MAWTQNVELIVMVTSLVDEMGKVKCEKYWADENMSLHFGQFEIYTKKETQLYEGRLVRRDLDL